MGSSLPTSSATLGMLGAFLTCLTVMTPMRLLTLNSYHFQICDPEKASVAEVVLASDPFYADHDPGLSAACRAMVDG